MRIVKTLLFLVLAFSFFQNAVGQTLPTEKSTLFSGSGNCSLCHEPGAPNTNALLDIHGNDVSPVTLWRSSMMANAFRDPFWQAKVSAEIAAHPQYQQIIEDKCTTCHAPMARTEAIYNGADYYALSQAVNDPLAKDGVSCTLCHQIKDINMGAPESFSGHYTIENVHLIYGPFLNPPSNPMQNNSGYKPVYGEHTTKSELCATCHTLFTPTVDNDGNIIGEAPEQTPYLDWQNSKYPAENIECQTCHMPYEQNPIVISNRPNSLGGRSPFAKHYFVGGNVFMQKILKKYGSELGVTSSQTHFDSTIARTLRLLQQETADLSATYFWDNSDTLVIKVAVKNKTGHKFPAAYPSRRAWLYLNLKNSQGESVFQSGDWSTANGEINNLTDPYEAHHDVITSPDQVQIYQALMKDVDGKVNYTLLRAAGYIKDNRIPPEGFTTSAPGYEDIAIEGLAQFDPNFNRANGIEGSGADTVTYKIGGIATGTSYTAEVKLLYQTLAPRFIEDLFQYSTPEVDKFKSYYQQEDNFPVTIDSLALSVEATGVKRLNDAVPQSPLLVNAYPNPFNPVTHIRFEIGVRGKLTVNIYNLAGRKIKTLTNASVAPGVYEFQWSAKTDQGISVSSGQYFIEAILNQADGNGKYVHYGKIVYLK